MNKCYKCGTEFDGDFCPQCGTKYEKEKTCPNCQAVVDGSVKFCNYCGYNFVQDNSAEQNGVTSELTTAKTRRAVTSNNPFPVWKVLAKILPNFGIVALVLFSLILWALFAAPFASIFGESLGNVYSTINGTVDDYLLIAQISLSFAVISFVYAAVTVALTLAPRTSKITVGKFSLSQILSAFGNLLYAPFFALGFAAIAKSKEIGMENGSYSDLMIAFSVVFFVMSVGVVLSDVVLRDKNAEYFQEVNSVAQAKFEREELRRQIKAENRAKAIQTLAEQGICEPDEVKRVSKKLTRLIWWYFKLFTVVCILTFGGYIVEIFVFLGLGGNIIQGNMWILFYLTVCFAVLVFSVIKLVRPIGIYRNIDNIRQQFKRQQILAIVFLSICALLVSVINITLSVMLILALIVSCVLSGTIKRRFNFNEKKDYAYTTVIDGQETPLTIELFCQQRNAYKGYCKDLRYYNYTVRRLITKQPSMERKKYDSRIKSIKAIVIVAISAVVMSVIVAGIVVDSKNIFKKSKVSQIYDGMTKDQVINVLGETEFTTDYSWSYYSSNYVKVLRKMEDFSKQMSNAQSVEQMMEIQKQIDNLQSEVKNLTYKYITISFDADGKVTNVKYDFNYSQSKAEPSALRFNCIKRYCI